MSDSVSHSRTQGKRWLSKRWIILGSASIVVVVVALVILLRWLAAPSLMAASQLDSMLLDAAQINTIMGTSEMQTGKPARAPAKHTFTLSRPDCLGALSAAQAQTYKDSGYTELHWLAAKGSGDKIDHVATQAVAVFPDVDKASAFVEKSAVQWKACAEKPVTVTEANHSTVTWNLKTVVGDPPKIAVSETRQHVKWICQRAMRAVSNAVIDATACGSNISDQGSSLAEGIAANVSK